MTDAIAHRSVPVELTASPAVQGRVRRLTAVSAVALGLIFGLAVARLDAPTAVAAALAAGWVLMPLTLAASLVRPLLRCGLVVPASLVSLGLLAVCAGWLPDRPVAAAGWVLLTVGVALGGGLGLWLWYRLLPVPARLDDPLSAGRWTLIAVHVGLILAGLLLVIVAG